MRPKLFKALSWLSFRRGTRRNLPGWPRVRHWTSKISRSFFARNDIITHLKSIGFKLIAVARKGEISPIIQELEDKLYAATQVTNFTSILNRITATLTRLPTASPETKKTLINSVIERLDVGSGEIIHLSTPPLGQTFFLILGRDNYASGETRTLTPVRAQALNLLRMPIPPPRLLFLQGPIIHSPFIL